jgi:hypothetical protein
MVQLAVQAVVLVVENRVVQEQRHKVMTVLLLEVLVAVVVVQVATVAQRKLEVLDCLTP